MHTVKEPFDLMAGRFRADKAAGTNAVIQYDVSGDGGGTWHAVIKDGTCAVNTGAATGPGMGSGSVGSAPIPPSSADRLS